MEASGHTCCYQALCLNQYISIRKKQVCVNSMSHNLDTSLILHQAGKQKNLWKTNDTDREGQDK